jgi:ribA/ribD-fused uncharacterized protein
MSEVFLFYHAESPFSNFHPAKYNLDGITFTCAEQGMMFSKAALFYDTMIAKAILDETEPKVFKALGRKVSNFNDVEWKKHRENIVYRQVFAKFSQNPALSDALLATGDKILAEASPRDVVWGIGYSSSNPKAYNPSLWRGSNLLGKILMRVREDLRKQIETQV